MSIIHNRKIKNLTISSDDNKVVCEVYVRFTSYDDSNKEETTVNSEYPFELKCDGISLNSPGFIPFENLTKEIVEGWIEDKLLEKESSIYQNHISRINSIIQSQNINVLSIETTLPPWE